MIKDKTTIGLNSTARAIVDDIVEARGWFKDQMDAAKFAMSLAIQRGAEVGICEGTGTSWNVGSFDGDGDIRTMINLIYPDTDMPYRQAENLINVGLQMIGDLLAVSPAISAVDLLKMAIDNPYSE